MSLTRFRSNVYQRYERENRRREKRPAARAQNNEYEEDQEEREREREKEAVVVVVSKVEGLKSSYHFFCCLSVRVFLCGRRVVFRNMSLSINTSTTLQLLLLLIQYYKFILHSTTRLGGPWRIRARRAFHSRTVGSTRPSTIRATARRPRRRPRSTSAKPGRSFRISIGS